jgi:hypothetical protein
VAHVGRLKKTLKKSRNEYKRYKAVNPSKCGVYSAENATVRHASVEKPTIKADLMAIVASILV